eukprot:4251922-Amphidinium_carterae.1
MDNRRLLQQSATIRGGWQSPWLLSSSPGDSGGSMLLCGVRPSLAQLRVHETQIAKQMSVHKARDEVLRKWQEVALHSWH